jgi:hypothetical protein
VSWTFAACWCTCTCIICPYLTLEWHLRLKYNCLCFDQTSGMCFYHLHCINNAHICRPRIQLCSFDTDLSYMTATVDYKVGFEMCHILPVRFQRMLLPRICQDKRQNNTDRSQEASLNVKAIYICVHDGPNAWWSEESTSLSSTRAAVYNIRSLFHFPVGEIKSGRLSLCITHRITDIITPIW